ncbi:MAG: cysteine--tRNA ligase [Bifidobacteriaceae bacterium]|jgi:cysteinyl-tRNA synthetase|nr:cysteine--tRNA ligase [Bifidobacteriaceae bacterium]
MQIIYDSASGKKKEFAPLEKNAVSIYLCGPTVQSEPHIGHIRSAVSFDIIIRWLSYSGFKVKYIRNITDINDKIFATAEKEGSTWWEVSSKYANAFRDSYKALGCTDPTYEPLASAHISQMIELVTKILDAGHAYIADDGVYFDTVSYSAYGSLTNQGISENDINATLASDAEEESKHKKNQKDFALWKFASEKGQTNENKNANKITHPVYPSPWGSGRPGWHLECSAMAKTYLGESFDIHGGGLDLRFPHHENEQAQSQSVGYPFAQNWLHTAWVTQSGEKMSKSLGNGLLVKEILKTAHPYILRFALGSAHYRSQIEWTNESLKNAENSLQSVFKFAEGIDSKQFENVDFAKADIKVTPDFADAMNDDFNAPKALSVIYKNIKENANPEIILLQLDILGLNPLDKNWHFQRNSDDENRIYRKSLDRFIQPLLKLRADAKKNKQFEEADKIRDRLASANIEIEDTPEGAKWKLKG